MLLWKFYLINPTLTLFLSPASLQNARNNQSALSATWQHLKQTYHIQFDSITFSMKVCISKALLPIAYRLSSIVDVSICRMCRSKSFLLPFNKSELRIAFALNSKHIFALKCVWFCVSHHRSLLWNTGKCGLRETKTKFHLSIQRPKTEFEYKSLAQCKLYGQKFETIEFGADFEIDSITKCILMSFEEIHYCKITFSINREPRFRTLELSTIVRIRYGLYQWI